MDCCGNTRVSVFECNCPEPEKVKPKPAEPAPQKAIEVAVKAVERAQKKEAEVIKKVEVEKERQPNGIIDLVARVLSDNAKIQA
jgi:outer membrane protein assembly factor BamA